MTVDASATAAARSRWRRWRVRLAAGAGVVLVVVVTVLVRPGIAVGVLDPDSVAPDGSRATAQVLERQGVEVTSVGRAATARDLAGPDSTLLVVGDGLLTPTVLEELEEYAGTVVLVRPDQVTLDGIGVPLEVLGTNDTSDRADPSCDVPAARAAGPLTVDAVLYADTSAEAGNVSLCYAQTLVGAGPDDPDVTGGAVAVWEHPGGQVVVLGSRDPLTNGHADEQGYAALALWTLGSTDDLVWWLVDPTDPALLDGPRLDATDLLPPWVSLVLLQLFLVVLAAMWWRGRRLGRLVPEPLPVVVRSAETTQGRAALYRRAGARDRAATVLRARAVVRVTGRLGLGSSAGPAAVVSSTSAATGVPAARVHDLLFGPPPRTDAELTSLADALDALADGLGRPTSPTPVRTPTDRPPGRPDPS